MCMSSAKVLNSSPSQHEALCVLAHLTRGHLSLKTPLSDLSPSFSLTLSLYKLISSRYTVPGQTRGLPNTTSDRTFPLAVCR